MAENHLAAPPAGRPRLVGMYLFCAVAMSYGWGWRGVFGHEAGAMVPGALVAMAICLASARRDWYRRCVLAGLCGAVGWSWGGTLTNMEHRLYILSDTPVDVVYGFACIGLVGLLWAGIGGAILALAFTRSRAELNRFIGPLAVMGGSFCLIDLYALFWPDRFAAYEQYTRVHWHDGEWLGALLAALVLVPYWLLRPRDRPATRLLLQCTAAWWIGYLGLTKFGGIELAPPYRSESWAGVAGILAVLIWYHLRNQDRAALLLTFYAMLAGCVGFILALQIHVPFAVGWGPCRTLSAWKHAEESFGFCMGFGVALAAGRLIRGELAAAVEDADRGPLDLFGTFVLVVVMLGWNLKIIVPQWRDRYGVMPAEPLAYFKAPFPQLAGWVYFLLAAALWLGLALYTLALVRRGRFALAPASAFGKGALLFATLITVTLAASFALRVPAFNQPSTMMSGFSLLVLAGIALGMLLAQSAEGIGGGDPVTAGRPPSDPSWKLGWKHWTLWAWVPVHILLASAIALAMVQEPWRQDQGKERHRFGPNATWRLELQQRQAGAISPRSP